MAVRLTGGDDITPEVRDFMTRYGVRGYPTLYVMNADGHVVVAKVDRTVDGMLKALADGEKAETEFAEAKSKSTPEGKKAYRAALRSRMAWDELLAASEAEAKASASPEVSTDLAAAYAALGRPADERAALEKAVGEFKDAPDRTSWRIRLATMDADPSKAKSREEFQKLNAAYSAALDGLLAKLVEEKDAPGAATVHVALGSSLQSGGKADDAEKHFDAALVADPKGRTAPTAIFGKANCAWARKDYAGCKTMLQRLVAEFPESEEGKRAPKGIENCDKKLEGEKK